MGLYNADSNGKLGVRKAWYKQEHVSISVSIDATCGSDENVEWLTQLGGVEESWGRCGLAVDVETQISFEDFQARRKGCALLDDPDEPSNMNDGTISISDSPRFLFVGLRRGKGLSDNVKKRGYRIQTKRAECVARSEEAKRDQPQPCYT